MDNEPRVHYIDSSVILRAVVDGSKAVAAWWEHQSTQNAIFISSKLLDLEVRRVIHNISNTLGVPTDYSTAEYYLDDVYFMRIQDELIDSAISLAPSLSGADSLHIATALRVGSSQISIVTHDAQMARAALALEFAVIDPVTDDPNRQPVVS